MLVQSFDSGVGCLCGCFGEGHLAGCERLGHRTVTTLHQVHHCVFAALQLKIFLLRFPRRVHCVLWPVEKITVLTGNSLLMKLHES